MGKTIVQSMAEYLEMLSDEDCQGKKNKDRKQVKTKRLPEIKPQPRVKPHEEEKITEEGRQ
jgi:hypothetical protein